MLKIEGKTFMNIQEAVQWLLDNNALPFQSSANYIANTEIGMGTIVNPSPAKVRIGSLIFFADSKVSTVTGLTENGFIVSDQYNNLVDDIAYVTNVSINASGHLITTLSDGQTIDAGIVKQVSSFSINGSQHLIASYNDGTSTDLGAIFSGNVTISGNLTVTGGISGDSIIENMTGYSFAPITLQANATIENVYMGVCKNGNKITFVWSANVTRTDSIGSNTILLGLFTIPASVHSRLIPVESNYYQMLNTYCSSAYNDGVDTPALIYRETNNRVGCNLYKVNQNFTLNQKYYVRIEVTFLLSNNLAS